MENLDYIYRGLKTLIAEVEAHPLGSEDIRKSYLELIVSVFNLYYIQWNTVQSARVIQQKKIGVTPTEKEVLSIFVNSVFERDYYYMRSNSSYRNLLLESWSTFEFCLTYLCESLFSDEVKKELLEEDLNCIKKVLSGYPVSQPHMQKIEKMFYRAHLTHVPITRKYNKIYSLYKQYYKGDWREDSLFLEFYGKYRNCMHTNYIYHGKDKSYTFLDITYDFIDGEAVGHSKVATIDDMFDLAVKLKSTCMRLFDAIQYPGLLPFPSDKVIQP